MLYKLQNGKLITPPTTGVRHTGETVSGYNRLEEHELRDDGWKGFVTDEPPEQREGWEIVSDYEQDSDTIYLRYREVEIPQVVEEEMDDVIPSAGE